MLRRSTTDQDRIAIVERYQEGAFFEDATRLLLGGDFDLHESDLKEFRKAVENETHQYLG